MRNEQSPTSSAPSISHVSDQALVDPTIHAPSSAKPRRKNHRRSPLTTRLQQVEQETTRARQIATQVLSLIEELEAVDLRALRVNSGMTYEAISDLAQVSTRTWIRWEQGELRPQWFDKLKRVCRTMLKD